MSTAQNHVTFIGNLTRDPEVADYNGRLRLTAGIAVNRSWKNNSGAWEEDTSFFNLILWGDSTKNLGPKNIAGSLKKGDRVIVVGRMEQREYEQNGEKKYAFEIVVDEMGPSLRWAEADVRRQNNNSGGGNNGGGNDAPPPAAPPAGGEEPF